MFSFSKFCSCLALGAVASLSLGACGKVGPGTSAVNELGPVLRGELQLTCENGAVALYKTTTSPQDRFALGIADAKIVKHLKDALEDTPANVVNGLRFAGDVAVIEGFTYIMISNALAKYSNGAGASSFIEQRDGTYELTVQHTKMRDYSGRLDTTVLGTFTIRDCK